MGSSPPSTFRSDITPFFWGCKRIPSRVWSNSTTSILMGKAWGWGKWMQIYHGCLLFDPPEPQIIGKKHSVSRRCYLFAHLHLLSSYSFSSLIFSLLLFSSLTLPTSAFPSVHIVGSLTSKLPSIKNGDVFHIYVYIEDIVCIYIEREHYIAMFIVQRVLLV